MDAQLTQDEIEAKYEEFRKWIDEQPDLPKKFGKALLLRYLKICRWRLEKAQKVLRASVQYRTDNPHIFSNRDPLSTEMQSVFEAIDMVPLSTTTPENYKLCVFRMISADAVDNVDFNDTVKAFFVMSDVALVMNGEAAKLSDGEISIFDMEHVSYRHLTKVVLSTVRLYLKYIQEAHPVRVRQMHIINCNPIIDKITLLIKPFMSTQNYQLINFHTPGSDTLFNFVPKDAVPVEMGGTGESLAKLKADFMKQIEKHREYIIDDDLWRLIPVEKDEENEGSALDFLGIF